MTIKFTISGAPKGKQRPRFCRIAGRNIAYTPKQTQNYEQYVRQSLEQTKNQKFKKGLPLEVQIQALFPIPKNVSQKTKKSMLKGEILPAKRPDADNTIKIILDALNGVAFHDDAQICKIYFTKKYAEKPETKVLIKTIEGT